MGPVSEPVYFLAHFWEGNFRPRLPGQPSRERATADTNGGIPEKLSWDLGKNAYCDRRCEKERGISELYSRERLTLQLSLISDVSASGKTITLHS